MLGLGLRGLALGPFYKLEIGKMYNQCVSNGKGFGIVALI